MKHLFVPPWNSWFAGAEGFFVARKGCFLAKHHSLPPHDLSCAGLIYWPPWNSKFWLLLPPWNSRFLYNQLFLILYCSSFPKSPLIRPKKAPGEYPKPIHNINVHRLITQRNRPGTQFLIHPYRPETQNFYTISFFLILYCSSFPKSPLIRPKSSGGSTRSQFITSMSIAW